MAGRRARLRARRAACAGVALVLTLCACTPDAAVPATTSPATRSQPGPGPVLATRAGQAVSTRQVWVCLVDAPGSVTQAVDGGARVPVDGFHPTSGWGAHVQGIVRETAGQWYAADIDLDSGVVIPGVTESADEEPLGPLSDERWVVTPVVEQGLGVPQQGGSLTFQVDVDVTTLPAAPVSIEPLPGPDPRSEARSRLVIASTGDGQRREVDLRGITGAPDWSSAVLYGDTLAFTVDDAAGSSGYLLDLPSGLLSEPVPRVRRAPALVGTTLLWPGTESGGVLVAVDARTGAPVELPPLPPGLEMVDEVAAGHGLVTWLEGTEAFVWRQGTSGVLQLVGSATSAATRDFGVPVPIDGDRVVLGRMVIDLRSSSAFPLPGPVVLSGPESVVIHDQVGATPSTQDRLARVRVADVPQASPCG